jgi:hypothetical protein
MLEQMINQYLFSRFSDPEFNNLTQIISQVFTPQIDLKEFYDVAKNDFNTPEWGHKQWRLRSVFTSSDPVFQTKYQNSPVIGIDLPSLFELNNEEDEKTTIAIIAQDPLRKVEKFVEDIETGTPFGLEKLDARNKLWTNIYMQMIDVLLELNVRVYLSDLLKLWVASSANGNLILPGVDQKRFKDLIPQELNNVKAQIIITFGKTASDTVKSLNLKERHIDFPHPSRSNNGGFTRRTGMKATNENKVNYFRQQIVPEIKKILN